MFNHHYIKNIHSKNHIIDCIGSIIMICMSILFYGCASSTLELTENPRKKIVKPLNSFFREQPLPLSKADSARMSHIALEYYIQASELELVGKYSDAILAYQRVLRFDSNAAVFYSIGKCYNAIGQGDLAIEFTEKSLKLDSVSIPALEQLAILKLENIKELEPAIDLYKRIYALDSNRLSVLIALAELSESISPESAVYYYKKAIVKSAYDDELVRKYGGVLLQIRDSLSYISLMENQYNSHPENSRSRALLIEAYSVFKEYDKAFTIIEQFAGSSLDEELEEYYQTLAFSIIINKDTNSMTIIDTFLPSFEKFPTLSWKVLNSFAFMADYSGKKSIAEKFYERSSRLADSLTIPYAVSLAYELLRNNTGFIAEHFISFYSHHFTQNPSFPFLMGIINNNNKQYSEAISYYSEAIKRDAEYADAWSELGSLYIKNKEFPKGDSCYGQALALEPDNPLYNNNFAYALSERSSELYKAQELAKKAISLDPENSSYLDTYGWILFKQGNINKAILILEKAVRITSEQSAIILYHLSEAYKQANEDDKAYSTLKKALLIDPENLLYIKSLENPK